MTPESYSRNFNIECVTHFEHPIKIGITSIKGHNGEEYSNKTYIYDFSGVWKLGPEMSDARVEFGCAKFFSQFHRKWMIAVIGGHNSQEYLNRVELLSNEEKVWIEGPNLPVDYWYSMAAVTNPNYDGIIIVGGYSRAGYESKLLQMTCKEVTGCQWKVIWGVENRVPRLYFTSFLIHGCDFNNSSMLS